MSGFFGVTSKEDCVFDLFFGTDYHSHLGTRRAGMAVYDREKGFDRSIHNIENSPFRTKFDSEVSEMRGQLGIGCISDYEPQPLIVRSHHGTYAIVTVGKINNTGELADRIFAGGHSHFMEMSGGDINQTELAATLINQKDNIIEGIRYAQESIDGSMSLLLLTPKGILAARDRLGRTPVVIGQKEGARCVSFESFAYLNLGYAGERELGPGEIMAVEDGRVRTVQPPSAGGGHLCIFEYIYFARPDSTICGQSVHQARLRAGRFLAQEHPAEADVVIGVPDSGLDAALGYAEASGIPYGVGLVKNRYIGRTFITPGQGKREQAVRIKLGALRSCVEGKRVVMVDDSIVRGTTSRQIVSLLREAGAAEVHLRSSAPPFTAPCYFGTDIPDKEELIACRCSVEEIRARTGADSLGFLSLDALKRIAPDAVCGFCDGCFTGKYPMPL